MSNKSKGDSLESLIQYVYQELSNQYADKIEVKQQHTVIGKSGAKHNIDVYYEFKMNGIVHKVIIECKNLKAKVSKEKVLALKGILEDIPNSVGIIVAPKGFQSGAEKYAKHHGIELISKSEVSWLITLVTNKLQIILSNNFIIGEPFYCLMGTTEDGNVNGNYITQNIESESNCLILFISRLEAEKYQMPMKVQAVVQAINQTHLKILCNLSKNGMLNLTIKSFMKDELMKCTSDFIEEYFLINKDVL